jgi:signal transduction histidine kinase
MREISLQTRVSRLLIVFGLLVTLLVALVSVYVNERLERSVWHALLSAQAKPVETSDAATNAAADHGELRVYDAVGDTSQAQVPPQLRDLPAGFHDEVEFDGREHSVLVTDVDGNRRLLTYDTSINEGLEQSTWNLMLLFGAALAVGIWVTARFVAARAARSVLDLAAAVRGLPAQDHIPKLSHAYAVTEVSEIAVSINGLLDRIQGFVDREREFINAVSHELTTPIAVIAGATDVLTTMQRVPAECLPALRRIDATTRSMNDILKALLFLAREPRRAQRGDETCRLDQLLTELIELHGNDFPERRAALHVGVLQPVVVAVAPAPATIVLGNVIRNALQHSLAETIEIRLESDQFIVQDNGRGMSPEAISRAYSQRARAGTGDGGGLGLSIVQRVCSHLGWGFSIASFDAGGTVIRVELRDTVVNPRVMPASDA